MFVLNEHVSIANQYLAELRDVAQQQDRLRFRLNLERLGELLAYEISKTFTYTPRAVKTPLAECQVQLPEQHPILVPILRAGLPFYQGFGRIFDRADTGFIGAYRAPYTSAEDLSIALTYQTTPSISGRTLIVIDPMLASGKSMVQALETLCEQEQPAHIHIAAVIAAPEGVAYLKENLALPYSLWVAAIDDRLNEHAYIVPGLGDAGDLSYGEKL
ncbi:uracil phosphoribosyltransferase [Cesiribacter andamanensis]|uniref:Uracil phosphoribosyltransferase n=1 Tax=Cesiribacter andamanensis AMV16 TaxID=1279009 RepID=M7MZ87_9BACT|nr:uracil phosphoribosyltransferase [Cesiribacter andamanensis]EMR01748.1 Uracil phosphoribosyltransferase [Cesiribacter andamanensis AMV16]